MEDVAFNPKEGRRLLRRTLKNHKVLDALAPSGGSFSVTDVEGNVLHGSAPYPGEPAAPVIHEGKIIGQVYGLDRAAVSAALSVLVDQAGESRAIASDALEKYKELTMLYALSDRLFTLTEVEEIGALICAETEKLAPTTGIAVLVINEETSLLEIVSTVGRAFSEKTAITVQDDLIGSVLSSGRGEIVNELGASDRRIAAETDFASVICVPLKARERVFGVVVAGSRTPVEYTAGDLQLVSALASQAAAAIEVARLNKVLVSKTGKPAEIIYSLDDKPPLPTTFVLGVQHALISLMLLATPIIITLKAGGTRADAAAVISMSMIAIALTAFVQSYLRPPWGAGLPLIPVTSVIFLTPSLFAAEVGGLGLVFGMTVFAGLCIGVFSQIIARYRKLFPPEISGVVVLMVGLSLIRYALPPFVGISGEDRVITPQELIVGIGTLAIIIVLTVSSVSRLRLFSTVIGIGIGTVAYGFLVGFDPVETARVFDMPLVGLPSRPEFTLSFDIFLALPFIAAAMAAAGKDAGLVTSLQKANDRNWRRPETRSLGAAIMVDGASNVVSGLAGGVGLNTNSGNVGLAIATGALSRVVGVAAAGIILLFAFMPIVVGMLALMPAPVIGAGLIYTACFLIGAGIQLVQSRMMDARRTFTIGLAIIGGIGVEVIDFDLSGAPVWVGLILGNSLAFSTFLAVSLNILLSLGVSSNARLTLPLEGPIRERILQFVERNGALWGARSDVVQRAAPAVTEWCEELRSISTCERVNLDMRFDEFSLTILIAPESFTHPAESRERPATLLKAVASHIQSRYEARVAIGEEDTVPSARLEFMH